MYRLQKVQNHAAKVVFRKSRHEHDRPLLKALHFLPVKDIIVNDSHFRFLFIFSLFFMVPCHHTCHCVFLYTLLLALSVPVQMEKNKPKTKKTKKKQNNNPLSCARWKLKGFGYRSFSVQAPFVWNYLPAHIRHCSSLSQFKTSLKKHFSVLLPTLSYSKPFTSIGCCTFFDLGSAADVFTG